MREGPQAPSERRGGLAVTTRGLVHIYRSEGHDVAALSGVDLTVREGEVVGLLGPSGAGKSTLLTLFGGLLRPSAGTLHVGPHDLGRLDEAALDRYRATEVGVVLQGAARNLLPYLTARQNVELAQRAARAAGRVLPPAAEVLALVGLRRRASTPLERLTPGQLQLTALAVAVAAHPGLLLGDEPTSQLDHGARDEVLDAIREVNRQVGTTVVIVTHDAEVAARLPRTVTIRDGRVGGEGRSGEEYAVVAADGSLPLPPPALLALPPGTLVRVHEDEDGWRLQAADHPVEHEEEPGG
ncbi:ABC transporter ATP-binding protein [Lapillicoccus jejuensis]|uniref:ABC-type lipoprotein export system ATPase subunit n=1 Tax=Lapillicoccus jejuensis TaxID=402171 RepID=A0A542E636_9MICO|nr:ATP-binding cassette domain-containing protein [Lapillicoccus jejuensis]TQJ10774.1 ABC-type lipoprotein export system ATPase subunit [Lapillicoccus jejuensis]